MNSYSSFRSSTCSKCGWADVSENPIPKIKCPKCGYIFATEKLEKERKGRDLKYSLRATKSDRWKGRRINRGQDAKFFIVFVVIPVFSVILLSKEILYLGKDFSELDRVYKIYALSTVFLLAFLSKKFIFLCKLYYRYNRYLVFKVLQKKPD